jgi:cytochrome c-type biogenesis protein CcmF
MVELGQYALLLTIFFVLFAIGAAAFGGWQRDERWVRSAERSVYAVFGLLVLAILGLEYALYTDRFDLMFVTSISSREQPTIFKFALWAGSQGSLLLWGFMLSGMSALAVFQNRARNRTLMPWVICSLMANLLFFAVLLNFTDTAAPFRRVPDGYMLSNGQGMNPLLQHPAMLIHPPILYTGFVGFAVPFSFALAALVSGQLGTQWFRTTRRWTLTAWFFLGVGIMLGGRWAYEVLGWGGYWAWDPVENASLMPWLVGTAYLHSVMIQEKRGMLKIWNLALIGLTYVLCLFGTFLTRSGVVQSVHSFSDAGWFGTLFLIYVGIMASIFFGCLIWRVPLLRSQTRLDSLASREASFLLNNYAFLGLLAVVFFGTLYPPFSEWYSGSRAQYGPPFFERYAGPISLFLLALTGVGPLIAWRRATLVNLRKSFLWPAAFGAAVAVVLVAFGMRRFYPVALIALCGFVTGTITEEYYRGVRSRMRQGEGPLRAFAELINRNRRRYAGYIVHLAVVLMFIGFAGAAFDREETRLLKPGETWEIGSYKLQYRSVQPLDHRHYAGAMARLALWHNDQPVAMLQPEKRFYFQQEMPTTLPAVSSSIREDLYVILASLEPDQSIALKVFVNPLVNWIWAGGLVFVLGNTLLLWRSAERTRELES